jgi:isohexenylglutaconyl-CoA hydratase
MCKKTLLVLIEFKGDNMFKTILLEKEKGWLNIWLNRPASRNALSEEMVSELKSVLIDTRADESIRGITLRGKEKMFCAGGDLKGFKAVFQNPNTSRAEIEDASAEIGILLNLLNTMPQVVVTLVEGAAVAGGMGLMCCGDVVITTTDAFFSLTETTLGIPPAQIAPFVMARIGLSNSRRLMLTASRFDGIEAHRIGLADLTVDNADDFISVMDKIKRGVFSSAPKANAKTKALLFRALSLNTEDFRSYAAKTFTDCMLDGEGLEGVASFIEKRKPSWTL